jgi:hypothetical protein
MKGKFTLTGTDNDGFRHRYGIRKNEKFKKAFYDFMGVLEFDVEKIKRGFFIFDETKGDVELKISDFEDCIRNYHNKKYDVDVFYGKAKIIIVVRTKKRDLMIEHLEKSAGWIKTISAVKIKSKNKKKVLVPLQKMRR